MYCIVLTITRGEIFGFLGSNGCGKSTTMKMLTGLLPPTDGTANLFGHPIDAGSLEVRKHLGYMTQAFSLYGELTVRQNLVLDARLYHIPKERADVRIHELVHKFGLESHLDALAGDLPMGLRQRLSLAVAVLHEPELLILDEPTSGVDPVARDSFWELLINFYVTPTSRLEYLLGKQLPYIAIGMLNFFVLVAIALLVFGVPIKGSFGMLVLCTLLYVAATTGIGLVISSFTSSQVAAVFVTAIITIVPSIQFSGFLQPVSTLEGQARLLGLIFPTSYYMHCSVGAFTKGLDPGLLVGDCIFLACCVPVLWAVSTIALKKQEK